MTTTSPQRGCDWQSVHPTAVEQLARALAKQATGVDYTVPPGCYVREACAQLHPTGCPVEGTS